ncbi:hypothetical protein [Nocardia pseudovaccinii]|uniref:hypothetical protein n=1 Tax=Nocardia pseudovaccinii TaxID=189540 RepID=UPI0007A3C6DB|nr:hypothetical protein [Nocardia pseudovaccinii]
MKSAQTLLSAKPTLWFLFLFNLAIALAVGFEPVADSLGLEGVQQIVTCVGMGLVSLGAGAALLRRRLQLV